MITKETRERGKEIHKKHWKRLAQDVRPTMWKDPQKLANIMTEHSIELLCCYLPEMDEETAARARRTIRELEAKPT